MIITHYLEDHCPLCGQKCTGACKCPEQDRMCDNGHTWRRDDNNNYVVMTGPHGNPIPKPRPTEADFAWAREAADAVIERQRTCAHSLKMIPEWDQPGIVLFCLDCGASLMECGHTSNDLIDGSPPWCYICAYPKDKLEVENARLKLRVVKLEQENTRLDLRCTELELAVSPQSCGRRGRHIYIR